MSTSDLLLVLASALLHAAWSAAIKGSRDPLLFNVLQLLPPAAVLAAVLPWVELADVPVPAWWILAGTSAAHAAYLYWMSRAYEHGDLTLVYPIARSTPAFLPLVAVPILGESISPLGALGIAVVVGGMWGVQLGQGWRLSTLAAPGTRFAYLTLTATIAYSLCDKAAMATLAAATWSSPVPRAVFYCLAINVGCGIFFVPLALRAHGATALIAAARRDAGAAALAAAVSFLSYGMVLTALESAPVSYVVAVRQTSVLFALLLAVVWLRERPGRLRVTGGAATVLGVALIALAGEGP